MRPETVAPPSLPKFLHAATLVPHTMLSLLAISVACTDPGTKEEPQVQDTAAPADTGMPEPEDTAPRAEPAAEFTEQSVRE